MVSKKAFLNADSYGIILPSDNKQTIEKKEKEGKKIRTTALALSAGGTDLIRRRNGFIRWRDWLNPPASWLYPLANWLYRLAK